MNANPMKKNIPPLIPEQLIYVKVEASVHLIMGWFTSYIRAKLANLSYQIYVGCQLAQLI